MTPTSRRIARLLAAPILVASLCGTLADAAWPRAQGRPLVDVLKDFAPRGLRLIFSTAVVDETWIVATEPRERAPEARLAELLAPFGLHAEKGPGDVWIVVAGERRRDPEELPPLATYSARIVVRPKQPNLLDREPADLLALDSSMLDRVPNAQGDPLRVLQMLPGVSSADGLPRFSLRGGLPRETSVVLDGLELYEPFHLASLGGPFSVVDGSIVRQLDFLGGGLTAEWGDRLGGFVRVETHEAVQTPRRRVEVGSNASRITLEQPQDQGSGAMLVAGRLWYPQVVASATELDDEALDPRFGDLYAKAAFHLSRDHRLSVHLLFTGDRVFYGAPSGREHLDEATDYANIWVRSRDQWAPGIASTTVLSAGRLARRRDGELVDDEPIVIRSDHRFIFLGLTHQTTWVIPGDHVLKVGASLRWMAGRYRYNRVPSASVAASETFPLHVDPTDLAAGVFAAQRAQLGSSVAVEVGIRWDRQRLTGDSLLSPRLNLLWQLPNTSELRLAIGRFVQSQRPNELDVEDGETTFRRPEVSRHIELSFRHDFSAGPHFRLNAFSRQVDRVLPRYENLFVPDAFFPERSRDRIRVAPETSRMVGAEVLLEKSNRPGLFWWLSYTYGLAYDRIGGETVPRGWDQTHTLKGLWGFRARRGWSATLSGIIHRGWPTTPIYGRLVVAPDGSQTIVTTLGKRNSSRLPTVARLDLEIERVVPWGRRDLSIVLAIHNLTDRRNAWAMSSYEATLNDRGGVTIEPHFLTWPGITPTLNIRLRF